MRKFLFITLLNACFWTTALAQSNTTCISACGGTLGDNIFPNGDFGSGVPNILQNNPFLAPGYIYTLNPPPDDGYYNITNNTTFWGSFANIWVDTEDNGPEPNGYMMVVNATYQPGLFYQRTVDICDNTPYEFSIDVINLAVSTEVTMIRPNISFLINGNEVCETGDIIADEQWHSYKVSFLSAPGQSTLNLALRNNAPGGYGNDLAIDNISFRACKPALSVPPVFYFCEGGPATVFGKVTNSPYNSEVYLWQILNNGVWTDIPNSNNDTLVFNGAMDGDQLRLLISNSIATLSVPSCRLVSDPILLIQQDNPVVQASGQNVSCFGGNDATGLATIAQGSGPFNYSWNSGQLNPQIQNLSAGSYTVTVTDAVGCKDTAFLILSEPPALVSSATATSLNCYGGNNAQASVLATGGTPPLNFLWSNGSTDASAMGLSAGSYQVVTTDQNGCTQSNSVMITAPDSIVALSSGTAATCAGTPNASATISATGGTGPFSYLWSNGASTANLSGVLAGNYGVTVTDQLGCTQTNSISLTEPTVLSSQISHQDALCFGANNGSASVVAAGGTEPWNYVWSNGASTDSPTGLAAGTYFVTITDLQGCSIIASTLVSQPSLLSTSTVATPIACFGVNNGSVTVTATGGTAPWNYVWNNGASSTTLNGLASGLYQVTVTDALGCSSIASAQVTEAPGLSSSFEVQQVHCAGFSDATVSVLVLGGTPPWSYLWSNGQSSSSLSGLPAGNYSVTISDQNGCTQVAGIALTEPPVLSSNLSATAVSCFGGNNASATLLVSGGTPPWNYAWSDGATDANRNGLTAGDYQVSITDQNGCLEIVPLTISEPPALSSQVSNSAVSCFGGNNGQANVLVNGGVAPYTYLWSNGQTNAQANNLSAGVFQVTTTDQNGCTNLISTQITQAPLLSAQANSNNVACFGNTSGTAIAIPSGGTLPYQYLWSTGQTSASIQQLSAGNYQFTVSDVHACSATGSVVVTQPPALLVQASKMDVPCFGENGGTAQASISGGTPPYNYQWSNGQTGAQMQALSAGVYALTVTDQNGCTSQASVQVHQPEALVLQTIVKEISCPGKTDGTLLSSVSGGVSPFMFQWNTGQNTLFIKDLSANTYTVTVTDQHGCTTSLTETLSEPAAHTVDLGPDLLVHLGDEITLNASLDIPPTQVKDYTWTGTMEALQCVQCAEYSFQAIKPGCQQVVVRNLQGCAAEDEVCFKIIRQRRIYPPNIFSPDGDGENDYFTIFSDLSVAQIVQLSIFDRWGEQVYQRNNFQTNDEYSGWDGNYKGQPMNIGVFVWMAELEFIDGERLTLTGDVTLVR